MAGGALCLGETEERQGEEMGLSGAWWPPNEPQPIIQNAVERLILALRHSMPACPSEGTGLDRGRWIERLVCQLRCPDQTEEEGILLVRKAGEILYRLEDR